MNSVDKSIHVFGIYLIVVGLGLMSFPTLILDLFHLQYGDDIWIRFVGLLLPIIGVFDLVIARNSLEPTYIWTVRLRIFATLFMVVIFLSGKLGIGILVFAAADLAGALWTWSAIRQAKAISFS